MSDFIDEAKETVKDIQEEAKGAVKDIQEEAKEVVQEAKAAVQGQRLESADTVGGAGYRADNKTSSGKATASLVLGILSLACSLLGYGAIAGLVLGIIGVVLGARARKEAQTGIATAGFVCSIIGTILSAVGLVCAIACVGALGAIAAAGS